MKKITAPPASHRDPPAPQHDPDALAAWTLRPIGVVRSTYRHVHDAPRQAPTDGGERATIELRRGMQNCLKDLAGFEFVWVVFVFSYSRGWRQQVVPPRDVKKRGVLATRSPHRPNPIGITAARLVGVRGRTISIEGHDLLDGTPVLDVKPYLAYCDSRPEARAGWVDELPKNGQDHRWK